MKCEDCKEREGMVEFCESVLDYTHGFKTKICRQCYIKRIEAGLKGVQANLKKQKGLLAKEEKNNGRKI